MNENNEVMNEQQTNGLSGLGAAMILALTAAGYAAGKVIEIGYKKFVKPMFAKKVDTDTVVVEVETSEE